MNYCRNPTNGKTAWCYTMDPNKKWEYCAVPTCGSYNSNYYKLQLCQDARKH